MSSTVSLLALTVIYLVIISFCCVGEINAGNNAIVSVDSLTEQYLSLRGMSVVKTDKPNVPFLHRHAYECRQLSYSFKNFVSSAALTSTKKCSTQCYQQFILDKTAGNSHGLSLVLYRDPKLREYLFWIIKMIFHLQVDIVDVDSSQPQTIDLCRTDQSKPIVILGQYKDFDFDIKSSKLSLKGLQYTCSSSKVKMTFPARITKLLMLVHDPLLRLWRHYVTNHMPVTASSSTGDYTGMLHFNWSQWDSYLSHTITVDMESILRAASQDLSVALGEALMAMPKSIVKTLRSDELADRPEVDTYMFVDLYLFLRGGNFSYTQNRYRREVTPADSILFHEATHCISSTFIRKNSSLALDLLVQRYVSAAFSAPSIACQLQSLLSRNPFMKEFPLLFPFNLTCEQDRDISNAQVQREHKLTTCRLRYPDRANKEEITTHLPVAIVGGYDKHTYDVRRLLEYASSQYTGALRSNMQVASSFPAETQCSIRLSGVHATPFNLQPFWSPYDLELRFDPATLRRCRFGLLFKLSEAIVVLDDPFVFLWRKHFNPQAAMYVSHLSSTTENNNTSSIAFALGRELVAGHNNNKTTALTSILQPPTSLSAIFQYWDTFMATEKTVSSVFGDGAHQFLHTNRTEMPARSIFPVSAERLMEDAHRLLTQATDIYTPLTVNETSSSSSSLAENALVAMLRFAHFTPETIADRLRCAFAFLPDTDGALTEIDQVRRFYETHPDVLCRVQTWVRNHSHPLHRRMKLLFPLTHICGVSEPAPLASTSLEKCKDTYAVRHYRDDTSSLPATLVSPKNTQDTRVLRILIEHASGLYTGSTDTSLDFKGVFPADEYCGRRMAMIHAAADFLSFSQREDGSGTYLRLESKGARTRCRRGVVTHFVESVVLMRDPFVLIFESLFPQLSAMHPPHSPGASDQPPKEPPIGQVMFSTITHPFSEHWQKFNHSLSINAAQLQAPSMEKNILKRLEQLLNTHFAPNVTAVSRGSDHQTQPQTHFLGSAVDEYVRSPYYETANGETFVFVSLEAVLESAQRLSTFPTDGDISQHVFQEREALFRLLQTAKLLNYVAIDRLKCAFAFVQEESQALLQRMQVVKRFFQMYPNVLCRVRRWVTDIFAPHEVTSVYALLQALPHGQKCT